tara:strand:+ start:909 stop:1136 length:228 start_codon:yes stop_codon:yes gene_type:complete
MKTWQERLWDWYTHWNGFAGAIEVPCEWCCGPMTEENITEGDGFLHCGCVVEDDGFEDEDADYRSEQVLRYAENN